MPNPASINAEPTVEQETQMLKAQADQLQKSLEQIRGRIAELEAAQPKER